MTKKSVLSILLIALVSALILFSAAGCSKPKPEPKLTPTAAVSAVASIVAPAATPTPPIAAPTVITTIPTTSSAATTAAVQPQAGATPTTVVIPAVPPTAVPATTQATAEWFLYTIEYGDTLFSLANEYGTSVEVLSALNNLSKPDEIQAGMQIKVPKGGAGTTGGGTAGPSEYAVQAGDDLYSIAKRYGVTVEALVAANRLSSADFIYVGQVLTIPAQGATTAPATSGAKIHVVKAGESIDMIAGMYGTTRQAIVAANNLTNPDWIFEGQKLTIP